MPHCYGSGLESLHQGTAEVLRSMVITILLMQTNRSTVVEGAHQQRLGVIVHPYNLHQSVTPAAPFHSRGMHPGLRRWQRLISRCRPLPSSQKGPFHAHSWPILRPFLGRSHPPLGARARGGGDFPHVDILRRFPVGPAKDLRVRARAARKGPLRRSPRDASSSAT